MDLLAHVLYGTTACSRSGLAGGLKGAGRRWTRDRTVWYAVAFSILPDLVSMGVPFLLFCFGGMHGNFFRDFDESNIPVYRYMHSLVISLGVSGVLRLAYKPLFIASLAWPLHVVMDALTHNLGKFRTTLFYPFTDWAFEGIAWWQHDWVVPAYWGLLIITWLGLRAVRHAVRARM